MTHVLRVAVRNSVKVSDRMQGSLLHLGNISEAGQTHRWSRKCAERRVLRAGWSEGSQPGIQVPGERPACVAWLPAPGPMAESRGRTSASFTWSRSRRNCWKSRPGGSLTWRGGAPSRSQRQASVLEVVDVKQTYCIDYLNIGWNASFLKVFLETCLLVLDSGWGERPRGQARQTGTAGGRPAPAPGSSTEAELQATGGGGSPVCAVSALASSAVRGH